MNGIRARGWPTASLVPPLQEGTLEWPFWTKLIVVAIGFTGGLVFMYVQCKMYVQLCKRWRAFNRVIYVQNAPEKVWKTRRFKCCVLSSENVAPACTTLMTQRKARATHGRWGLSRPAACFEHPLCIYMDASSMKLSRGTGSSEWAGPSRPAAGGGTAVRRRRWRRRRRRWRQGPVQRVAWVRKVTHGCVHHHGADGQRPNVHHYHHSLLLTSQHYCYYHNHLLSHPHKLHQHHRRHSQPSRGSVDGRGVAAACTAD